MYTNMDIYIIHAGRIMLEIAPSNVWEVKIQILGSEDLSLEK